MRLVFEHHQPVLLLAIDIHLHADAAGVVLLGNLLVGEVAALVLVFAVDGGQVHQGHGPLRILAVHFVAHGEVFAQRILYLLFVNVSTLNVNIRDGRLKGRVAAVVAPVGVQQFDFGVGGVALLVVGEILLDELQILQ